MGWRETVLWIPLVPNQLEIIFVAAAPQQRGLDAAPPCSRRIGKAGLNGPQVSFRWYNFRPIDLRPHSHRNRNTVIDVRSALRTLGYRCLATVATTRSFSQCSKSETDPPEIYTQSLRLSSAATFILMRNPVQVYAFLVLILLCSAESITSSDLRSWTFWTIMLGMARAFSG